MAKSKEDLIYDIENNLVDSNTGKITGERVKARLLDMVDAMGTGQLEYYGMPEEIDESLAEILFYTTSCKVSSSTGIGIYPAVLASTFIEFGYTLLGFTIDRNLRMVSDGAMATIGEMLESQGISDLTKLGFVLLTEEEFYTI